MKRNSFLLLTVLVVWIASMSGAFALDASTLYNGCRGEEVKRMQQALIDQGYLGGYADGIFGRNTENAVRKFQAKHRLTADGLAGKKTLALLYGASSSSSAASAQAASSSASSSAAASASPAAASAPASSSKNGLFSGNYETLRIGSSGERVRILQKALIAVGALSGSADGRFGNRTKEAVVTFQKSEKLTADGLAGKKTLTALESASASGKKIAASSTGDASSSESAGASVSASASAPDASSLQLLHWFNDIKPNLRNKQKLVIVDPASGLSWTLQILSRGRHCDAEPLTREDTETMLKAFGGQHTWDVKKVYVRLPNGVWTIGTTHDKPHDANTIKDNGFNGHTCVHFLRDMAEAEQNDPNYGVTNQKAIRAFWKSLTGQEIAQ